MSIRPAKRQVLIGYDIICPYGNSITSAGHEHVIRRAHVLRVSSSDTVWPGDFVELDVPNSLKSCDTTFALEPHTSSDQATQNWLQPTLVHSVAGKIRVPNLSTEPQLLKKNDHFCQVRAVFAPEPDHNCELSPITKASHHDTSHSTMVQLDPDNILPTSIKTEFQKMMLDFDDVFFSNSGWL